MNGIIENAAYTAEHNPWYIALVCVGMLSGGVFFVLSCFRAKKPLKQLFATAFSAILAVIYSLFYNVFISRVLDNYSLSGVGSAVSYTSSFSFFSFLIIFAALSAAVFAFLRLDANDCLTFALPSVWLAMFFGKLGCFVCGCCASRDLGGFTLPLNLFESLAMLALFIASLFGKRLKADDFLLFYLIYRFVFDFIRDTYIYEQTVLYLSPVQIVSLIAIIIIVIIKAKNCLKNRI